MIGVPVQDYRCETASQYCWFGWVSAFHLGPRSPLEPRSACGAHCRARLVSSFYTESGESENFAL